MADHTKLDRRAMLGAAVVAIAATPAFAQQGNVPTLAARFAGRVVAITGATSGIGRATAEALAREGERRPLRPA